MPGEAGGRRRPRPAATCSGTRGQAGPALPQPGRSGRTGASSSHKLRDDEPGPALGGLAARSSRSRPAPVRRCPVPCLLPEVTLAAAVTATGSAVGSSKQPSWELAAAALPSLRSRSPSPPRTMGGVLGLCSMASWVRWGRAARWFPASLCPSQPRSRRPVPPPPAPGLARRLPGPLSHRGGGVCGASSAGRLQAPSPLPPRLSPPRATAAPAPPGQVALPRQAGGGGPWGAPPRWLPLSGFSGGSPGIRRSRFAGAIWSLIREAGLLRSWSLLNPRYCRGGVTVSAKIPPPQICKGVKI